MLSPTSVRLLTSWPKSTITRISWQDGIISLLTLCLGGGNAKGGKKNIMKTNHFSLKKLFPPPAYLKACCSHKDEKYTAAKVTLDRPKNKPSLKLLIADPRMEPHVWQTYRFTRLPRMIWTGFTKVGHFWVHHAEPVTEKHTHERMKFLAATISATSIHFPTKNKKHLEAAKNGPQDCQWEIQ